MRSRGLIVLGLLLLASVAAGADLRDLPPPDIPAEQKACVDSRGELSLCPDAQYRPPLWLLRPPTPLAEVLRPSSAETRHRELMEQLDRIENAVRDSSR